MLLQGGGCWVYTDEECGKKKEMGVSDTKRVEVAGGCEGFASVRWRLKMLCECSGSRI